MPSYFIDMIIKNSKSLRVAIKVLLNELYIKIDFHQFLLKNSEISNDINISIYFH